jgi:protocatechuate 4,5-dioxygenase, alpha chain
MSTSGDAPIPETTVFTGILSQQGYRINKLAMSLADPANRERFRADEQAYMAQYGLSTDAISLPAATRSD